MPWSGVRRHLAKYPVALLVLSGITDCAIGDLRTTNCAIGGIPLLGLTDGWTMDGRSRTDTGWQGAAGTWFFVFFSATLLLGKPKTEKSKVAILNSALCKVARLNSRV
jgi:hypothetical protein